MTPVGINGISSQCKGVNGVQTKQALNAANETVSKGVYNATTLSSVDADLAVGNIKGGVTIFGKLGTYVLTETIEKYADASLAIGATYTPAASGIFFALCVLSIRVQYYSTVAAAWYSPFNDTYHAGVTAIGDGTNFRLYANAAGEYCLMRHYSSLGTYTRDKDEQLAEGASYTPAASGFFANAMSFVTRPVLQINRTTAGWTDVQEGQSAVHFLSIVIGDGTNLRVTNPAGAGAQYHVLMRAKMS